MYLKVEQTTAEFLDYIFKWRSHMLALHKILAEGKIEITYYCAT